MCIMVGEKHEVGDESQKSACGKPARPLSSGETHALLLPFLLSRTFLALFILEDKNQAKKCDNSNALADLPCLVTELQQIR